MPYLTADILDKYGSYHTLTHRYSSKCEVLTKQDTRICENHR